jgi:hypothetical protein
MISFKRYRCRQKLGSEFKIFSFLNSSQDGEMERITLRLVLSELANPVEREKKLTTDCSNMIGCEGPFSHSNSASFDFFGQKATSGQLGAFSFRLLQNGKRRWLHSSPY